jgi:hypothetical protein
MRILASMIDAENIDPRFEKLLEQMADWIDHVTGLCLEEGPEATHSPIDEIADENRRRVIYWLILARASDQKKAIGLVREQDREDTMRAIVEANEPSERKDLVGGLEDYVVSLETYIQGLQQASFTYD